MMKNYMTSYIKDIIERENNAMLHCLIQQRIKHFASLTLALQLADPHKIWPLQ